jgi:hypothetical protein
MERQEGMEGVIEGARRSGRGSSRGIVWNEWNEWNGKKEWVERRE